MSVMAVRKNDGVCFMLPPSLPPDFLSACRQRSRRLSSRIAQRIHQEVWGFSGPSGDTSPQVESQIAEYISSAITTFLDVLDQPTLDLTTLDVHFRDLGEELAASGHHLDALQAAQQIATQEAWDELLDLITSRGCSIEIMAKLGDAVMGFQRRLFGEALSGFRDHQASQASRVAPKARLLHALLTRSGEEDSISRLADGCDWRTPDRVCVLGAELDGLVDRRRGVHLPPEIRDAVLLGLRRDRLIAVTDADLVDQVSAALAGQVSSPLAVSWPVPPAETRHAYRWVGRTLELLEEGLIAPPSSGVVACLDYQAHLCLHADPALRRHADEETLAPLLAESPKRRADLAQTMLLWLQSRSSAPVLAAQLGVHSQTVRNRIRRIETLFADQLADQAQVFGLLAALESVTPRWRAEAGR